MERVHNMPESTAVDASTLMLAWGYVWRILSIIMLPIIWLFVKRVREDNQIVHDRIDDCVTKEEMNLRDKLTDEKNDRMVSAIVRLEKCAEKQEGTGK